MTYEARRSQPSSVESRKPGILAPAIDALGFALARLAGRAAWPWDVSALQTFDGRSMGFRDALD